MRESTLKRFLRLPRFEEHLELHRLDVLSSNRQTENYGFVKRKLEELPGEQLKPARLVTGADLIAAGYSPGPVFSEMLSMIEDAQLENRVETREQALEMVRERFGAGG
jgi:poly(A) polymerase